ncbi:hypothetical protein FQN50_007964 [Emmonsiellopsis sp. PD_5]|nr:hypothetical protein FQN50_007964 [Emmonsiellopsis sp. PD_5]
MASQQQHSQNSSAPAHQASFQPYQSNGANPHAPASFTSTSHASQPAAASKQHDAHQPAHQHPSHNNGCGQGTAAFLKDFNLVAEAAKRAQIAVIARDLEGVSL